MKAWDDYLAERTVRERFDTDLPLLVRRFNNTTVSARKMPGSNTVMLTAHQRDGSLDILLHGDGTWEAK